MFLQIIYPFFHNKIISYNLFFSLKILFLVHDNIALFYLKFFQFLITLILTVFSLFLAPGLLSVFEGRDDFRSELLLLLDPKWKIEDKSF